MPMPRSVSALHLSYEEEMNMIGQNVYNRVSEQAQWVGDESKEIIDHYPVSTALAVFGLGIGVGVALVTIFWESEPKYDPGNIAQRFGHQVLEAMSNVVPDAVTKKFWG